jgi:predicted RNase H-like nuclease (RuvC/YqgF family)
MTEYVDYANMLIALLGVIGVFFLPRIRELFRDVGSLKEGQVELKGEIEKVDLKVEHIEGGYKQGIAHLDQRVEKFDHRLDEMQTDIKELLKLAYGRRRGGEPQN